MIVQTTKDAVESSRRSAQQAQARAERVLRKISNPRMRAITQEDLDAAALAELAAAGSNTG